MVVARVTRRASALSFGPYRVVWKTPMAAITSSTIAIITSTSDIPRSDSWRRIGSPQSRLSVCREPVAAVMAIIRTRGVAPWSSGAVMEMEPPSTASGAPSAS